MHTRHTLRQGATLRLCLLLTLISALLLPAPAFAQAADLAQATDVAPFADATSLLPGVSISAGDTSVRFQFAAGAQAAALDDIPLTPYGGYLLPMQTLLVESTGDVPDGGMAAMAAVQQADSIPFTGELLPAPTQEPAALDWNPDPAQRPVFAQSLPNAPFFLLHEGMERNRHLAVFAFSTIYQDPTTGEIRQVENFDAQVAGAAAPHLLDAEAMPEDAALFAPVAALAAAPGPTNPFANSNAVKIQVDQTGMQQLTGAQLAAAGLDNPPTAGLRLMLRGAEIPLHIVDANNNGQLDTNDLLRFYVDKVGDNYNTQSTYWLVTGAQAGLRMAARPFATGPVAQTRNTAYAPSQFFAPTLYESTMPGYDGDHFFHTDLRIKPADLAVGADVTVTLPHALPLSGSSGLPTLLTLNLTPYAINHYGQIAHQLALSAGAYTYTDGGGDWVVPLSSGAAHQNVSRQFTLTQSADQWKITLLKSNIALGVKVDTVDALLPVQLNFDGKGARFQGVEGVWRYQLAATPTSVTGGRALYDITNPAAPQLLPLRSGAAVDFQDGPTPARYLLTGEGTLVTPAAVVAHSPVNMATKRGAHTLYIAPTAFHPGLQPLVDLRISQKYQVQVVDVQNIYDAWSWGMIDPAAIRSFLRFAVGTWNPAPIAATLVGDASWDPNNYLGFANANLLPAYLLDVDPYIRVTACENCFGQLNGDDPLSESAFLNDIWIGRFPVADTAELDTVVDKIVRYETATDQSGLWRRTILQIGDDYIKPDGRADSAGNFIASIEEIIAHMPAQIKSLRHYYMAARDLSGLPTELSSFLNSLQTWFSSDPNAALQRSINLMNSGVGIVTYTGHANHYFWARTETANPAVSGYLFGLNEVEDLRNFNQPFIALSMTCYTAQFPKPENRHYTLDERLFISNKGGAVAVWGPAGLSIAHGHDQLQQGFYDLLWKSKSQRAKLGALTQAGYKSIINTPFTAGCCMDVNRTFLLLGDPLTPARVARLNAIQLPLVQRVQ